MIKEICFDLDGSVCALYEVPGWLDMLRAYDPTPYEIAEPMWDMVELAQVLHELMTLGITISIVTWLSKCSTPEYDKEVREAKRKWLDRYEFPYDHFHGVQYGATKADSVRKRIHDGEEAILIDDNAKVRDGWHLGETIDPTSTDLIEALKTLLKGILLG